MEYEVCKEIGEHEPTVLLYHGATMPKIPKHHPLSRYFCGLPYNVISVQLPGHGSQGFDKVVSASEFLEIYLDGYRNLKRSYQVQGIVGISLGGVLALKTAEVFYQDLQFVVAIGAGVTVFPREAQLISQFFSEEHFRRAGLYKTLVGYHGEEFKYLLQSIPRWFSQDSALFPDMELLQNQLTRFLLILGDQDQPFPPQKIVPLVSRLPNFSTVIIENCDHFGYFSSQHAENVLQHINRFLTSPD